MLFTPPSLASCSLDAGHLYAQKLLGYPVGIRWDAHCGRRARAIRRRESNGWGGRAMKRGYVGCDASGG